MYYRRKILLTLLEVFDDTLPKMDLQKLLLLLSKKQSKPSFDFVPYKFGCFSFRANADLKTLIKYEQVSDTEKNWIRTDSVSYKNDLKKEDLLAINQVKVAYGKKSTTELLEITYKRFPFYATNSTILSRVLKNKEDLKKVEAARTKNQEKALFTIGYEGISLEAYLNKLLLNDIQVLVDVRKNSISMKYGFSKKQLMNSCTGIGIQFYHLPELGIVSDKRQKLETQNDYDILFKDYAKNNLPHTVETQNEIIELINNHNRVALTCFEANSCQCHRKPLAESIANLPNFVGEVNHI